MDILIGSILISFIIALVLGKPMIPLLRRLKAGQPIRDDGPQSHLKKQGTPTMGGVIMMLAVLITCLILLGRASQYTIFALIGSFAYALIGTVDDLIKVLKHNSKGLRAWQKIVLQFLFAILIAVYAYRNPGIGSKLYIPIANVEWDLGIWYIPFTIFVIIALTNSVNLTDGLDGLAAGVTLIDSATFTLLFYGMMAAAIDAAISGDMIVFSGAVTGACLGFLRYNVYPARVFMGDSGAFFLGGALSMMAIISRLQIVIPIVGMMFMLSSISDIIQVGSYKLRNKKRVFLMAPLHHHFEQKGIPETKIVSMYMIITTGLCLLTLLLLI